MRCHESTAPQLVEDILDGKETVMPAFRGRVSDEQAEDLTACIRAFVSSPAAALS